MGCSPPNRHFLGLQGSGEGRPKVGAGTVPCHPLCSCTFSQIFKNNPNEFMSKKSPWNPGVFTTENLCGFHFSREGIQRKGNNCVLMCISWDSWWESGSRDPGAKGLVYNGHTGFYTDHTQDLFAGEGLILGTCFAPASLEQSPCQSCLCWHPPAPSCLLWELGIVWFMALGTWGVAQPSSLPFQKRKIGWAANPWSGETGKVSG